MPDFRETPGFLFVVATLLPLASFLLCLLASAVWAVARPYRDTDFGALIYNTAHSYLAPVAIMTGGFATASPLILSIAMIWLAHIGFDRALGYGLKYERGFGFTHMGRIGKPSAPM